MPPLIANANNSPTRSMKPSAPQPNLQMPHVFVIPPEEEQQDNPPWCCFDADEQLENTGDCPSDPDIHFLDDPYPFQQPDHNATSSITRRTSVGQSRPRAPLSRKLEKRQRPEAIKIVENKPLQTGRRDAREDSDVIEVVKVKRTREALTDLEENARVKRSKTLKARATKALQSIKNVGKGSSRTHVKELWTSSESTPGIFKGMQEQIRSRQDQREQPTSPTKIGSLSRAASKSLLHILNPGKPSRPESSFALRSASSTAPTEAQYIPLPTTPLSLPHFIYDDTNLSLTEVSGTLTIDDALNRPISPSLSMKKKPSNSRFSIRELHQFFSFTSSSQDGTLPAPTVTVAQSPSPPNGSMPSTSSTVSSDYPDIPMEEDIFSDAFFLELDSPDRKPSLRHHPASRAYLDDQLSTPHNSDLNLEMRLNSLHFDSLSFDPEEFDVSMEGVVLR